MKDFIQKHRKILIIILIVFAVAVCLTGFLISRKSAGKKDRTETGANRIKESQVSKKGKSSSSTETNGLFLTVTIANTWNDGGENAYQLSGDLWNKTGSGLSSWHAIIDCGQDVSLKNAWNCTAATDNNKLELKNADYNASVSDGAHITDIGMIVQSSGSLDNMAGMYRLDKSGNAKKLTDDEKTVVTGAVETGNSDDKTSGEKNKKTEEKINKKKEIVNTSNGKSGTPYGDHGTLSVKGVDLLDKSGQPYQLKGVSTHGLQWFPQYVNEDAFRTLRDDWGANVVRLAMYTGEGGYVEGGDKASLEAAVDKGVSSATSLGMYVIIDWHVLNDSSLHADEAADFFSRMSKKYASNGNVLYEICNEPKNGNGGETWQKVKAYADRVIPAIRANDSDAIIIVGTPTWSQDVDQVAAAPVADPENVMYALHFYAGTHKDNIRQKLKTARAAGTPVFISEFSICDASGNGGIDYDSANAWKQLINENNISYCAWSLCNKNETSALISPGCQKLSGWDAGDLSETGKWVRSMIKGE